MTTPGVFVTRKALAGSVTFAKTAHAPRLGGRWVAGGWTVRQADPQGLLRGVFEANASVGQRTNFLRAGVVERLTLAFWHIGGWQSRWQQRATSIRCVETGIPLYFLAAPAAQVIVHQVRACYTEDTFQPWTSTFGNAGASAPEKSRNISSAREGKHATFVASLIALTTDRWHSIAKRSIKGVPRAIAPVQGQGTVTRLRYVSEAWPAPKERRDGPPGNAQ